MVRVLEFFGRGPEIRNPFPYVRNFPIPLRHFKTVVEAMAGQNVGGGQYRLFLTLASSFFTHFKTMEAGSQGPANQFTGVMLEYELYSLHTICSENKFS